MSKSIIPFYVPSYVFKEINSFCSFSLIDGIIALIWAFQVLS